MMAWVYILKSRGSGRYYIGSTNDLARRLKQHAKGQHHSSRCLGLFELVLSQAYPDVKSARRIERWLKGLKSRKIVEKIIADGIVIGPVAQSVRAGDS